MGVRLEIDLSNCGCVVTVEKAAFLRTGGVLHVVVGVWDGTEVRTENLVHTSDFCSDSFLRSNRRPSQRAWRVAGLSPKTDLYDTT